MNKDNAREFLPLVQALADGRTIQSRAIKDTTKWIDMIGHIAFGSDPEFYRVKPEPVELVVWHKKNDQGNSMLYQGSDSPAVKKYMEDYGWQLMKVREVLDE